MKSILSKYLGALALLLVIPGLVFAQDGTISGTIVDGQTGDPLPGANAQIPDLGIGAAAAGDGTYEIDGVPPGQHTLQVSFVGYEPTEETVNVESGESLTLDFELTPDFAALDELVVTGYGSPRERRQLTSSLASISAEDLQSTPNVSTEELLQGTAGVQVTSASGIPGSQVSVNIRGPSSIEGDSQPLFVVDGVPVESGDQGDGLGMQVSALSSINPRDIESIEVLKDASATAIYGSRGANGVVLIQTRRGQEGRTQISFSSQVGTQDAEQQKWDLLSGPEWTEIHTEAGFPVGIEPEDAPDPGWVDEAFETGVQQEHNLSIRGGDAATTFFVGGTFHNNTSFQFGNHFQRASGRANVEHQALDWLQVGASLNMTREINEQAGSDNLFLAPFTSTALMPPVVEIRDEDGNFNFENPFNNTPNVIATADLNTEDIETWRWVGSTFLEASPLDELTLRLQGGMDLFQTDNIQARTRLDGDGSPDGQAGRTTREQTNYNIDATAEWRDNIDVHSFGLLGGFSYEFRERANVFVFGSGTPTDDFRNVASAAEPLTTSSTVDRKSRLESYFFRGDYTFDDRYFVDFSARVDGSSRFADGNQYGFFPAGSIGWDVSSEAFMEDADNIDQLRLRFSAGITGSDDIGTFASLDLFGGGNDYDNDPGIAPSQLGSPDLQWEENTEFNLGVDFAAFRERISVNADVFTRTTDNLILPVPAPLSSGFSSVTQNVGEMRNRGVDLSLTTQNFVAGDATGPFQWRTRFNISYLENEVRELVEPDEPIISGNQRAVVGEAVGEFFLIPWEGVDPQTGKPVWRNSDGNLTNTPTAGDRELAGSPIPNWTGSITNTFEYNNLSLRAELYFEADRVIYNSTRQFLSVPVTFNMPDRALERWQEPGDQTTVPRMLFGDPDSAARASTRFLEDGAFLRVRNVTLSYSLPQSLLETTALTGGRFYVQASNLFTFDRLTMGDPEVSTAGSVNALNRGNAFFTAPQTRAFTVGVDIDL